MNSFGIDLTLLFTAAYMTSKWPALGWKSSAESCAFFMGLAQISTLYFIAAQAGFAA